MFNSIVDSFPGSNIIIYTPNSEKSISIAAQFDSLFKDYNQTATRKFTVSLLNTKDMMLNGKKTTAKEAAAGISQALQAADDKDSGHADTDTETVSTAAWPFPLTA